MKKIFTLVFTVAALYACDDMNLFPSTFTLDKSSEILDFTGSCAEDFEPIPVSLKLRTDANWNMTNTAPNFIHVETARTMENFVDFTVSLTVECAIAYDNNCTNFPNGYVGSLRFTVFGKYLEYKVYCYRDGLAKGTVENPYKISTTKQLYNVRYRLNKHYLLMNDIDTYTIDEFTGDVIDGGWKPIGFQAPPSSANTDFTGSFDGNGNTITYGVNITEPGHYGLFGIISNAIVKNLRVEGKIKNEVETDGWLVAGGIVGLANISMITDCVSEVNIDIRATGATVSATAGGIAGGTSYNTTIADCMTLGTISSSSHSTEKEISNYAAYAGGIVGMLIGPNTTISNCVTYGAVSSSSEGSFTPAFAGGIASFAFDVTISNCAAFGNVSSIGNKGITSGGIVGYSNESTTISYCVASGAISSDGYTTSATGGIVGNNLGNVTYCVASGTIHGRSDPNIASAGGIVGWNGGPTIVNHCVALNRGDADGEGNTIVAKGMDAFYSNAGRVVGTNYGTINNNYGLQGMKILKHTSLLSITAAHDGQHGEDVAAWTNAIWWTDTALWSANEWDFSPLASGKLPIPTGIKAIYLQ